MSLYHDVLDTIAAVGVGAGLPIAAVAALQATRSAKIANAQLKAEHRPLLLDVPYSRFEDGPRRVDVIPEGSVHVSGEGGVFVDLAKGEIAVPIRNVGRGVARIAAWRFVVPGHPAEKMRKWSLTLAIGEQVWIGGTLERDSAAATAMASSPPPDMLAVAIHYQDYLKTEDLFAVILFGQHAGVPDRWFVDRTEHELEAQELAS